MTIPPVIAGLAVAVVAFVSVMTYYRAGKCTNHCWGEWESECWQGSPLEMKLVRVSGGSKYLKVKKQRQCTHQGCRETQESFRRVNKYHSQHSIPNEIRKHT